MAPLLFWEVLVNWAGGRSARPPTAPLLGADNQAELQHVGLAELQPVAAYRPQAVTPGDPLHLADAALYGLGDVVDGVGREFHAHSRE